MLIGALRLRPAGRQGRAARVLILTVACDAVFGVLSIFAPSFAILLVLRFLTGIAVGGTLPVDYAMMAEFLPAKSRGRWLVALEGFWAVGTLIVALPPGRQRCRRAGCVALHLRGNGVAGASGPGLRFFVPESPLYLLRSGRAGEAKTTSIEVLSLNGKPPLGPQDEIAVCAHGRVGRAVFRSSSPPQPADPGDLVPRLRFLLRRLHLDAGKACRRRLRLRQGLRLSWCSWRWRNCRATRWPPTAWKAGGASRPWWASACCRRRMPAVRGLGRRCMVGASLLIMSFALLGTWGALYAYTPELYPTACGQRAWGRRARWRGSAASSRRR
jgi:putative MFS transporter